MTTSTTPFYPEAPHADSTASPQQLRRHKLANMSPNIAAASTFLHANKTTTTYDEGNQEQTDGVSTVMHTPRRGRRVGKVDLGWGSPLPSPGADATVVTPRKRKGAMHGGLSYSSNNIQLLDSQGRALAAIPRNVIGGITSDFLHNSPNLSVDQADSEESPAKVRRYDSLSLFEREEETNLLSALVPVEIPLMGRMAVHRSEIAQISCIDTNSLSQSSHSERDSSSSAGGSFSTADAASRDSQSVNGNLSPTFSFSSHFPASASDSPTKQQDASSSVQLWNQALGQQQSVQDKIQLLRDVCQKTSPTSSTESTPSSWKPRLTGADMPHLDWPDSPDGPWSSAGKKLRHLQEQKRRGIARWLEEESEDEEAAAVALSFEQQHPMVAKAMHDRARKEMLIRSLSMPVLHQSKHLITPSKSGRRRRSKDDASGGSRRRRARQMQKKSGLRAPHPLSSASSTTSAVGCACGSQDESTPMVQCDACNLWYHLVCIGVSAQELGDEWFCIGCCDLAANVLSPSSLGDRASLIATPNFPRSAAIAGQQLRPSQGQLPVFTHPPTSMHSPSMRGQLGEHHASASHHVQHAALPYGFPSALALAPSPELPSSMPSSGRRSSLAGRHRASRIGWHQMEPGSPLARKSGPGCSGHRRDFSGSSTANGLGSFPSAAAAFSTSSDGRRRMSTQEQHHGHALDSVPPRTPSPRLMSTPSRMRSGNTSTARSQQYRRESSSMHDYEDLFSTPSRILHGSATWGAGSAVRHTREDSGMSNSAAVVAGNSISTPWGLSTPIRGFMDGAEFSSDHSDGHGGLPSLVFSSGGMDLADLTWQLQSPSSSTRAATRARQSSVNRAYQQASTSSMRERTPTAQMYSNGSSEARVGTDGYSCPPSSSPFPKTPTFSDLIQHHSLQQQQQQQQHLLHHQHHRHSLQHSPSSAPSKAFNKSLQHHQLGLGATNSASNSVDSQHSLLAGSNDAQGAGGNVKTRQATSGRGRNVSSGELMAGLGIGLDLDDVLDWA